MISIRKPVSPTFCPILRTIPSIASKSSSLGTLPFAESIEPRNPTNTTPIVSTMPPSWTRLTRLCQYGLAWTLTEQPQNRPALCLCVRGSILRPRYRAHYFLLYRPLFPMRPDVQHVPQFAGELVSQKLRC